MPTYSFCNLKILSTTALPELALVSTGGNKMVFQLGRPTRQDDGYNWQHHWLTPTGVTTSSYKKRRNGHWLRFPQLADFIISPTAKRITCMPVPGVSDATIRHLLIDQVLPRCLAQQRMVMAHASAVGLPGGAVLFVGPSGEGKSTLAGYFHQTGNPVLADDCVRILEEKGTVKIIPSYGGLRVWQDSKQILFPSGQGSVPMAHYSSKQRVLLGNLESSPSGYPVLAIIVLKHNPTTAKQQAIHLSQIPRREVFVELMKQTFRLDVTDVDRFRHLMGKLGHFLSQTRAYQLHLPHDYQALPEVRKAILNTILAKE